MDDVLTGMTCDFLDIQVSAPTYSLLVVVEIQQFVGHFGNRDFPSLNHDIDLFDYHMDELFPEDPGIFVFVILDDHQQYSTNHVEKQNFLTVENSLVKIQNFVNVNEILCLMFLEQVHLVNLVLVKMDGSLEEPNSIIEKALRVVTVR